MNRKFRIVPLFGAFVLAACSTAGDGIGEPFSYSEDRCLGSHNQCQTDCTGLDRDGDGPARATCMARCLDLETRCYATGDVSGSSLAVDAAIGDQIRQREKEEGYERWKRERAKQESAEEEESE